MAFFELKGKLRHADAESNYIKDWFWKGLNVAVMEALMVEEAHNILLQWESKLVDLAAKKKGAPYTSSPSVPPAPHAMAPAHAASPPPSADSNTMDIN
ncbi:hypothetical protein H2248_011318 [Termitomyces sp. 'cryptogamus']|nr:hypothetical protein H2248_011318 [Termitomyces sp. 'cryptogamus']